MNNPPSDLIPHVYVFLNEADGSSEYVAPN
jgi:hypothetical protein